MTVSTFYSDAHPETNTVDGRASLGTQTATWDDIHGGAGNGNSDAGAAEYTSIEASTTTNRWESFIRAFNLFDTSELDGDSIDSATFEIVVLTVFQDYSGSMRMVTSNATDQTDLQNSDYDKLGTAAQGTDLTLSGITADSSTFNAWTLDSTGLGNINKTGITEFGMRTVSDATDTEPTWSSGNARDGIRWATAEETLSGDKRPKLVVTHTTVFTPSVIMF